MNNDLSLLKDVSLFDGVNPEDFNALLSCIGAKRKGYRKGDMILLDGNAISMIGVVLVGRVQIIKEDVFGNRAILNDLGPKAVFGESFVCGGYFQLTVSVQAAADSEILFLPFERVMHICPSACGFHNTLIRNMVEMIARKNIKLVERLEVSTKRTLRERILAYLSHLAQEQGSVNVISPLGRVDLADYLGADRSALTRELNWMRDAGLIAFDKNTYTLMGIAIV